MWRWRREKAGSRTWATTCGRYEFPEAFVFCPECAEREFG
jgi:hypothetical protein